MATPVRIQNGSRGHNSVVRDQLGELREAVEQAKHRYQQAIALQRKFFDVRMSGETTHEMEDNFSRWLEQHTRLTDALNDYQQAVNTYTEAIKRDLGK